MVCISGEDSRIRGLTKQNMGIICSDKAVSGRETGKADVGGGRYAGRG